MNQDEFNSIPKNKVILIGDIDKFSEYIIFNTVRKSIKQITSCFVTSDSLINIKMLDKYMIKGTKNVKDFVDYELNRYLKKISKDDLGCNEFNLDNDEINEITDNLSDNVIGIKRGDVDKIVITTTNQIINTVLNIMSDDKLVKLCWDTVNHEFIWMARNPGEEDKVETAPPKKKKKRNK